MITKFPKIIIAIFLVAFVLQLTSLVFLLTWPKKTQALGFIPQVSIGEHFQKGVTSTANKIDKEKGIIKGTLLPDYIIAIYRYSIGIISILATVVMMIGGIIWMTAGGNGARVGEAKAWIGASLTGLVLAITSYTILSFVNPNLVKFKPLEMEIINPIKLAEKGCKMIKTTDNYDHCFKHNMIDGTGKCGYEKNNTTEQICCCQNTKGDRQKDEPCSSNTDCGKNLYCDGYPGSLASKNCQDGSSGDYCNYNTDKCKPDLQCKRTYDVKNKECQ